MARLPRYRGLAPGQNRDPGRRRKVAKARPASAALPLHAILHKLSALDGVDDGVMPPGFRLAPGLNPVLRVLDLDVPALVEPLFQQDPLAKHLIGFIRSSLGVPLDGGEANGGGKQECKERTHGFSLVRVTMHQLSSLSVITDWVGGSPLYRS